MGVVGTFILGKMEWPSKEEIIYKYTVEALILLKADYQFLLKLCVPLRESSNVNNSGAASKRRKFYEKKKCRTGRLLRIY